jgi:hypothetical protein
MRHFITLFLSAILLTSHAQEIDADAPPATELSQYSLPFNPDDLPQPAPQLGTVGLIIIGGAIVGGGAYMSWKIGQEANKLLYTVPFPATINKQAPFWPINTAVMDGKVNTGLVVDCTSTAYHSPIPPASQWVNPNTGLNFTDTYVVRFRASSDLKHWSTYDAAIWVDWGHNFVMVYCGFACCGDNCNVIFFPAPDVGPNSAFAQAIR